MKCQVQKHNPFCIIRYQCFILFSYYILTSELDILWQSVFFVIQDADEDEDDEIKEEVKDLEQVGRGHRNTVLASRTRVSFIKTH